MVAIAAAIAMLPMSAGKLSLIENASRICEASNPRFSREKFYHSCTHRVQSCLNHKDCSRPFASRMKNGKIVRDKNTPCKYEA